MNLPEMLMKQFANSDTLNSLASAVGLGREDTTKAVSAAVPALLAAFAQTASTNQGAQQLANAVSNQDTSLLDNLTGSISSRGGQLAQQGSGLLSSLLGGSQLAGLSSMLSRFTGVGDGIISKILGMLSPLILGFLGRQTGGLGASGLANLLSGQKDFIKSAMPSGLASMLSSALPNFGDFLGGAKQRTDAAVSAARTAYERPISTPSPMKWVVPALVALCLLAALAMWARRGKVQQEPVVATPAARTTPEAIGAPVRSVTGAATSANFVSDTSKLITDATKAITDIRDSASADAAVQKIKEINSKLESSRSVWNSLPENTRTMAQSTFSPLVSKLEAAVQPVLSMPAIGDIVRPHVNELLRNLKSLTSTP